MDDYSYDWDDEYEEDLDDNYIWAEDSWELADELAASAMPEPQFIHVRDDEYDEYDMYDYWEEEEHGNDNYFDPQMPTEGDEKDTQAGGKRKRGKDQGTAGKRKRIDKDFYTPVMFVPATQAYMLEDREPTVDVNTLKPYGLLGDWRVRLKDSEGFDPDEEHETMEVAGKDVSEIDEPSGDDSMSETEVLDPAMLQQVFAAKLAESGLGGEDQGAFMQSLMEMLQGGDGADTDDIVKKLTDTLLGQASSGSAGSGLTQWLTQQGVSLEDTSHDEEDEVVENAAPDAASCTTRPIHFDSPKDSVASNIETTETASVRAAATSAEAGKKRKRASHPAPQDDTSTAGAVATQDGKAEPSNIGESEQAATQEGPPTTKKPKVVHRSLSTHHKAKTANEQPKAAHAPDAAKHAMSSVSTETSSTETKATRKRKAAPENESGLKERPKRQLRGGFAAPTASSQSKAAEASKKTTRSSSRKK